MTTTTLERPATRALATGVAWGPPRPLPALRMHHSRFRPLTDAELYALGDERLVAHVAAAKRAGDLEQARRAMHMLLYLHEARMRHRVALRLPRHLSHHHDTVSTWVLRKVMESALRLGLEGESVGEWVNWWGTAIDRQVISFWRSLEGKALEKQTTLPTADEDEGDGIQRLPDGFDVDRLIAQACYADIVASVIARMENPVHGKVVRMAFFEDLASASVAEALGLTAVNVDKIKSRFRQDLRTECVERGVVDA